MSGPTVASHSAWHESMSSSHENSYYNEHSRNFTIANHSQNRDQYYNLENVPQPKNFSCEVCNRSFYSHGQFKKHLDEHVDCPFPECSFKANMKMVDQHISHQHMLVNFEALQIDDEAWINERKKKFPTVQRAELRRAEQMERLKRGEKLGKDNKKFPKNKRENTSNRPSKKFDITNEKTNKSVQPLNNESNPSQQQIKDKPNRNKFNNSPLPIVDPYDSDSEVKWGVPAFKGTKLFFESTGEVSYLGLKPIVSSLDKFADIDISDEEEWSTSVAEKNPATKLSLQNALGSLMGAYDSNSDSESEPNSLSTNNNIKSEENTDKIDNTIPNIKSDESENLKPELREELNPELSDKVIKPEAKLNTEQNSSPKNENSTRRKRKHNKLNDNKTGPNMKSKIQRPRVHKPKRRPPTLLEKLLEREIVHERNVILQCITHIVENNFYQPEPKPQTEEVDMAE